MNVLDNMPMPDVIAPKLQSVSASVANVNNVNNAGNANVNNVNNNANNVNNVNNVNNNNANANDKQIFLMVSSRDLSEEEMELLKLYGKVLEYDNCHVNIPLDKLIDQNNADYVIFDVRNKQHRMAISKATVHHENPNVHVIAVVSQWEKEDDFVDDANCENCLASLPPKQAFKKDFDTLLLQKKIRQPSCVKSVIRVIAKTLGGCAKE
jgi:hypothetical protein